MKSVLVLMSTYNGEKYLREQIESIISQENIVVTLKVRDDGSTDGTIDILNEYQKKGNLTWYTGENKKPAQSFMDLIYDADLDYDYYSLSDQDDVWLNNKLSSAVEKIENNCNKPALYFSMQTYVDESLNRLNTQVIFEKEKYTFAQTFIKNMAAGCTMVMNKRLIEILKSYRPKAISMHDRWIYLVCSGVGGEIYYDKNSYILYRQHANNVTGNKSKLELLRIRLNRIFGKNQFAYIHALELKNGFGDRLTESNRETVNEIIQYKCSWNNKIKLIRNDKFRLMGNSLSNYSFITKVILNNL